MLTTVAVLSVSCEHFHGRLECPNRERTVPPQQRDRLTMRMRCVVIVTIESVIKTYGSPWSLHVDAQWVGVCATAANTSKGVVAYRSIV